LCTYFLRFTAGFLDIAQLLTELMNEKWMFQWSPKAEAAFQSLKELLCMAPVLEYLWLGEKFIDRDTSNVRIGGMLSQVQEGQDHIEAYYSRSYPRVRELLRDLMGVPGYCVDVGKHPQMHPRTRIPPTY
jgi:hypothetical protein